MNKQKEQMLRSVGFHKEVNRVREMLCPCCKKPINMSQFKDRLSRREYEISGMCQECQDRIFNSPEPEDAY